MKRDGRCLPFHPLDSGRSPRARIGPQPILTIVRASPGCVTDMAGIRLWWAVVAIWVALASPAQAVLTEENSGLDQDPNFRAAKQAVMDQDWDAAVTALGLVVADRPDSADAHAWLGYSLRRAGRFDAALRAYGEALRLSPRHLAAREYLGEAYLALDRRADAELQLRELDRLCGVTSCEEARQLRRAIEEHVPVRSGHDPGSQR